MEREPERSAEHFTRNPKIMLNLKSSHLLMILYCSRHTSEGGKQRGIKAIKHFHHESNRLHVGDL
jgi:hypothetical protein